MYKQTEDCQIPGLSQIYEKYFGFKNDGCFVEIGAYDGSSISNTCFLADIGWKGVYVEPVKEYYELCVERHKNNNNINCMNYLVGDTEQQAKIVYKGGDISTSNFEVVKFFNSGILGSWAFKHKGESEIAKQITLEQVFNQNDLKNADLMIIDTEGDEWNVIKNFDFNKYDVKMIIIELHELSEPWHRSPNFKEDNSNINSLLEKNSYKKIYSDTINAIFVKE